MVSGVVATIKWHHYPAAAINNYTVTPTNKARTTWELSATVVLADAFKMAQVPLVFVAKHAKGEWRFPVLGFARRTDGQYQGPFTATLGAPLNIPQR
jgi:hypothetical protein